MEGLIVLLLIAIPLLLVAGGILGLVSFIRAGGIDRRLRELEGSGSDTRQLDIRVKRLEELVASLRRAEKAAPQEALETPPPEEVVSAAEPAPEAPPREAPPRDAPTPPPWHQPRPVVMPDPETPLPVEHHVGEPRRRALDIDWERWIGVRGAAVVGGFVLALASLLLFQYTIEHNLIKPPARVILGLVVGIGCLFGSEWLIRRKQPFAANALTGAGVVALYASVWAARTLYGLIGLAPALVLMALTTVTCGLLAMRRSSLLVAVLGLVGGFATPLLVAAETDQPLTLFSYVLLLDAGLLWLARHRQWPVLALLSLAGTALHQGLWILGRMDSNGVPIGLAVLAVFAVGFLAVGRQEQSRMWRLTMAGAVAIPFLFALHFAGHSSLGDHIAPVAILLVLLSATACWLARRFEEPVLAIGGAAAALGVVTLWFLSHELRPPLMWEGVAAAVVLAAVYHGAAEIEHRRGTALLEVAAAVAAGTFLLLLVMVAAVASEGLLWPWLAGWIALAALLVRQAGSEDLHWQQPITAAVVALGLALFTASTSAEPLFPAEWAMLVTVLALAVASQSLWLLWRDPVRRRSADHAAALATLLLQLAVLCLLDHQAAPLRPLAVAAVLGLLAALAATRLRSGPWYLAAAATTAFVHWVWTLGWHDRSGSPVFEAFILQCATVVAFTAWPLLARGAFSGSRSAWSGAALAGPFWFLSLRALFIELWGEQAIGLLPIGLALLTLAAGAVVRHSLEERAASRSQALVWYLAVTLSLVSVAIPLQLEREWITIGWALNGLAVIALWRRLDHPGLKYFGLALLGAASVRLALNPAVLGYHQPSGTPVLNWLLYTYLVPAAALVGSGALLRGLEVERAKDWESQLYSRQRPITAALCGVAAVIVVFVWINLSITDAFAVGDRLVLSLDRMPARDLTTSIAWAVYGLGLLLVGMNRRSLALRWLSLLLFLATIIKVFLHDLGELRDLYRVASLFGLAVALILVSLFYQRYVLRSESSEET